MADKKVRVVIAFDADNSRIGKTVEVPEAEARVLLAEGRARLAEGKGAKALTPTEPTRRPPQPEVVPPAAATPDEGGAAR